MNTEISKGKAVIIGAGPAGLTAAWEFLTRTSIEPVVFESDAVVGGISRTVRNNGNYIDIGGHRFFSKNDRVMKWWNDHMPITQNDCETGPFMLVRNRVSRILFNRKFFKYPISIEWDTLRKIGFFETARIGMHFIFAKAMPRNPENTLEDFFINRFGVRLYQTFFRDYTQKVWGVPCNAISAAWGRQRVKGLSIVAVVKHAIVSMVGSAKTLEQKETETSLIERFLYPPFGPGQLWELVAQRVQEKGGTVVLKNKVVRVVHDGVRVKGVDILDTASGVVKNVEGDFFVSSMPIRELVAVMDPPPPEDVKKVAAALIYRDFITVGVLLNRATISGKQVSGKELRDHLPDNWIYIQEPYVRVGRIQAFNNWSPHMVADKDKIWLGLEYFVTEGDDLWSLSDERLKALALEELESLCIASHKDCVDSIVIRMPKAYPCYFGEGYDRFDVIRSYLDGFENLFLIGRNGMHRYNNQDHSMLSAMTLVDNLAQQSNDKASLWDINVEQEYHEEKRA